MFLCFLKWGTCKPSERAPNSDTPDGNCPVYTYIRQPVMSKAGKHPVANVSILNLLSFISLNSSTFRHSPRAFASSAPSSTLDSVFHYFRPKQLVWWVSQSFPVLPFIPAFVGLPFKVLYLRYARLCYSSCYLIQIYGCMYMRTSGAGKVCFLKNSFLRHGTHGRQSHSCRLKLAICGLQSVEKAPQLVRMAPIKSPGPEIITDDELPRLSSSASVLSGLVFETRL